MIFRKFKGAGLVNLIHDKDLENTLIKLDILKKIKQREIKCKFTKDIITVDNLHAIFYENNDIKCVSNSTEAVKKFSEYLNKMES